MNFAVPFVRKFKYFQDKNCELNINYKPIIKQLMDFIDNYKDHRINLIIGSDSFREKEDIKIIQGLRERYPECNLVTCLSTYTPELEQVLSNKQIPHYYQNFVNTLDEFEGFLSLDVTDIFITEELAFSALFLSQKAKEKNKSLRVFCNICQSSWKGTPSLKTFFIRPEDIDLYANFFDTFEFFYRDQNANEVNTFYEIYAKDKKWFGRLDQIIIGYEGEEDSRFFLPDFAEFRIKCQKKCFCNSSCKLCDRIKELGQTLQEKDLIIQIDKAQKEEDL